MTPTRKYIEGQMKECRERWFKDHVASRDSDAIIGTLINWQKPGTWNYGCRFIIHRRWLCVVGDIGEAIFEWGEDLSLDFLAGIDIHYFLSKCQASPEGRRFEQWDCDVAAKHCEDRIKEIKTPEQPLEEGEKKILDGPEAEEFDALEQLGRADKNEYERLAGEYYSATGDAEGASTISDMGVVPSVHAIGMFVGLQMAIAQLKAAK